MPKGKSAAGCGLGLRRSLWETKTNVTSKIEQHTESASEEKFFPRGAIAFFVTMIAGFGLIWLGIYLLLVQRQLWL